VSGYGTDGRNAPRPGIFGGLFILAAATLLFEITLTRLFSVAQFYHFAFMIISLAMAGFGASGMLLARFPRLGRRRPRMTLALLALAYAVSSVGGYLLTNWLPFDSFSIAWDRRQVLILLLHYLVLAVPFFCSGMAVGLLLACHPRDAQRLYAGNLAGSALGCLLALGVPAWLGGEGAVLLSALLGGAGALCFLGGISPRQADRIVSRQRGLLVGSASLVVLGCLAMLVWRPPFLSVRLSPYKGLSYALQFPGAEIVSQRWNSFSRVDVVESPGIRSLPGLSYRYADPLPPQQGIFVDGDDLSPTLLRAPSELADPGAMAFADFLPEAAAYHLRPAANVLVLQPRGGLSLWTALAQDAAQVAAVEPNALIVSAADAIYSDARVTTVREDPRSFVRRTDARYDLVVLALTTPYHPIRSGAYSLAEDYHLTVEAFEDYLHVLAPEGILVVTRWLQMPPSESLRAYALAVTALESLDGDPEAQIAAFRGYATLTLLVKAVSFDPDELATIRTFAAERAFDLVALPDLRAGEVNRANVLAEPLYAETFAALRQAADREAWYEHYAFDVTPPTDDHPFFGHFFTWSQAPQVWAGLGKSWQPFGGAGYFVLLALLGLALAAALPIVLVPLLGKSRAAAATVGGIGTYARVGGYFGLLGLGYLFVEIPLVQRFILFLGHPAYALTAVLFALLFFSGVGSRLAHVFSPRGALALVVGLALSYPWLLTPLFNAALQLPLGWRLLVAVAGLAPLGIGMGMPFPMGLRWLEVRAPAAVPWAWGVNGASSVVASVLAALLSLSCGFRRVLVAGALCYTGAWLLVGQGSGAASGSRTPSPVKGTKATPPRL